MQESVKLYADPKKEAVMKRRTLIHTPLRIILTLSIIYFWSTGLSFAQSDTGYQAPAGEMKKLADGVYAFLQGGGGWHSNSGVIVGKDYAILVDSQTNKYQAENLKKKIRETTDKPIRFIFNTHFHPDHTFTNHLFPGAIAITTVRTREETLKLTPAEIETFKKLMPAKRFNFDGAQVNPQDITFEGKMTVYDGTREIQFVELGVGHSNTDAVVYLPKERVVFMGDLVGEASAFPSVYSGSYDFANVLYKLAAIDADMFVPGHGKSVMTREQVASGATSTIEALFIMREEARKLFNQRMTYQEAAEKVDYDKLKKWGDKDRLYGAVFGNLARAWSEFRGEPPAAPIDLEEVFAKFMGKQPDGKWLDRIDMGKPKITKPTQ
jgi:glyoxylase-like metal-dependent hydrolase (beta-lactamase superfamily II)